MDSPTHPDTTILLRQAALGDAPAAAKLMPLVYDELRQLARGYLHREHSDQTLQPTALVHEAYLRLVDQTRADWQNRTHFFAMAAQMMRRVLVDHARAEHAAKRGGDWQRLTLSSDLDLAAPSTIDILSIDDALAALAALDERQSRVVELRFFGGLTNDEVAKVLGVSTRTVEGDWRMARAWLRQQLGGG